MAALDFPATPSNGDTFEQYIYDGTKEVWRLNPEAPNANLDNLNDVTITSPTDGQALVFDSASGDWVNETLAEPVETVINTDGDPGTKIYVGATDPDGTYSLVAGDIWIEAPDSGS